MKLWQVSYQGHGLEPAGIYKVLAKLRLVSVIQWLEFHRLRKAFKGHGTVSRINGGLVIDITEAY